MHVLAGSMPPQLRATCRWCFVVFFKLQLHHCCCLLQMVAMEDRPDAFVGIAAMDRGEDDNPADPK